MVIGEAPGAEEDRQGEPFVGRAGHPAELDAAAAGFERDDVFIANVLKCRPPQQSRPEPTRKPRAACRTCGGRSSWCSPHVILCVGRIAAQRLLGTRRRRSARLRGRVHRTGRAGRSS